MSAGYILPETNRLLLLMNCTIVIQPILTAIVYALQVMSFTLRKEGNDFGFLLPTNGNSLRVSKVHDDTLPIKRGMLYMLHYTYFYTVCVTLSLGINY